MEWSNDNTKSKIEAMKKDDLVAAYWELNDRAAQAVTTLTGEAATLQEQIQNTGQQVREQGQQIVDLIERLAAAAADQGNAEQELQLLQAAMDEQAIALEDLPQNVMTCRSLGELVAFMAFRYDPQQAVPPVAKAMLNTWVGRLRPMPQENLQPQANGQEG